MPKIGMRMIKTAIAVFICLLIYLLTGKRGAPVFSTIAAMICMQPFVENSVTVAFNRIIGTLVGAALGLLVLYALRWLPEQYDAVRSLIIALAVIPAMYITVIFHKTGAAAMAGVVLLSVTLAPNTPSPLADAFYRSTETIVGILVSLGVNMIHVPRRRREEYFFVSSFDGGLCEEKGGISPYCAFELNQLLHDGVAFTIATERTPASLLADIGSIDLKLPVIAMDGAVLFDLKEKRYLACNSLSKEMTKKISTYLQQKGIHYFLNVVLEDVLFIYYRDFQNEEERRLYERARVSPYRNYLYGDIPKEGEIVYILLVLTDAEADNVEADIKKLDTKGELLFLRDKTETPDNYCHLKIYHKNATKEYMMRRLLDTMGGKKKWQVVAFGSNKNDLSMMAAADISYATGNALPEVKAVADHHLKGNGDSIAHKILRLYEPFYWQKQEERQKKKKGE